MTRFIFGLIMLALGLGPSALADHHADDDGGKPFVLIALLHSLAEQADAVLALSQVADQKVYAG